MSNQNTKSFLIQSTIGASMMAGVLLVILNPNYPIFKTTTNYAVQIMFVYLFASIGFLLLKKPGLLFTGFACTAALCLFLQQSSNKDLVFPKINGEQKISVAQFNMSAASDDVNASIKSIIEADADVISLQEITPDWQPILKTKLAKKYPYHSLVYRTEDFLGIALYSRFPFTKMDTIYCEKTPNLIAKVEVDRQPIYLAATYFYPELNDSDLDRIDKHKSILKTYFQQVHDPVINFGEFNQVQWTSFIKEYKNEMNLLDSRRFPFFDNPTDHIFFSKDFECIDFKTITNAYTNHLGICGEYQIKMNLANVEGANRKF